MEAMGPVCRDAGAMGRVDRVDREVCHTVAHRSIRPVKRGEEGSTPHLEAAMSAMGPL